MKNYLEGIVDLTGDSYLNPTWPENQRSEDWIEKIVVHHDAAERPHDYDSIARYRQEAAEHYNRLGPGLQYHYKIDNTGVIFKVRPHTTILWQAGDLEVNRHSIAICLDGYFHPPVNQQPTREQFEALAQLLDWLSTANPQFPASQGDVYPHRHFSATACCGDRLVDFVDAYRSTGGSATVPADATYDWPELQPAAEPSSTPPASNPTEDHSANSSPTPPDSASQQQPDANQGGVVDDVHEEVPAHEPSLAQTKSESQPQNNSQEKPPMKERLTSRKFWLTAVGAVYLALQGHVNEAVILALGYFGVNVWEKK